VERVSRRSLLTTGGGAALIGAILGPGIAQAQADKPIASPWSMVVDVAMDPPSAAPAVGPFYGTATVYRGGALSGGAPASGAAPIGSARVWGHVWDPSRPPGSVGAGVVGTVAVDIAGQGEIVIAGVLDERAAIVGGTGNFRGVNGQSDAQQLGPGMLRVTLDITSYGSGHN